MEILNLIKNDEGLIPYQREIERRYNLFKNKYNEFCATTMNFGDYANGYLYYGLHKTNDSWILREWLPNASEVFLIGDFSDWKPRIEYIFTRRDSGNFELQIPLQTLQHLTNYKLFVRWGNGEGERIPAYARRVVQNVETKLFTAQVWAPESEYQWKNPIPKRNDNPLIYETHIGMSSIHGHVNTYVDFRINVLPRIAKLGYNCIQIMGIQEHPYYGSFGYQVSSFFAPSSRFGNQDELKELIDTAHGLGITVILDLVHSHAVKNVNEGLGLMDGTEYQYFHGGDRGNHSLWDSKIFNYGKNEVLHFLLSNCKYWLSEFHFDGFRFDGITSMLYYHHGLYKDFLNYNDYFDGTQDNDAITYLTLANALIHEVNPNAITIAEDVSGMPGLASKIDDGGMGFDFRMSMGVADMWVKILKEKKDEDWHVGDMFYHLTDKRKEEKTINYAECHDQAMMGDKTLIFNLLEDKMYTSMNVNTSDLKVDRGIAIHKLIRLSTLATSGGGYLNFMGNEFGHPEWIDFPREGNDWSHHHARRQWNLVDDLSLKYQYLNNFDLAMVQLIKREDVLKFEPFAIDQNNNDQILVFKRGNLVFAFNFNPDKSFTDYGFEIDAGKYKIVLDSDAIQFAGFDRNDDYREIFTVKAMKKDWLKLYLPSRSALVLKRVD
ncbi:MAG TPA: 1,4-alpha-glucan-branching enzyme [Bacteroidales bacterium]|nr:MAG: 1,4-alpha-glucan branching protein [Bacteroidetes bacterium GWF2_33_38]HBF88141.1 1,4-alpha-glucan-branching enzyme [Bacteroidales bacterium]